MGRPSSLICAVLCGIGMLFVFGAVLKYKNIIDFRENGITTTGTVIKTWTESRRSGGKNGRTSIYHHKRILFLDAKGEEYVFNTMNGDNYMSSGTSVPVIYLARDPNTADIPGVLNTTMLGVIVLGGLGVLSLGAFIVMMVKRQETHTSGANVTETTDGTTS